MKKILFVFAVTVMAFTACKKDSDKEKSANELIIGKWSLDKVVTVVERNGKVESTENSAQLAEVYEFKSGGSGSYTVAPNEDHELTTTITYEFLNNGKTLKIVDNYNYDINGDGKIDKDDIMRAQHEVKVLNSAKLEFYAESSKEEGTDVIKYKRTIYFTKQ